MYLLEENQSDGKRSVEQRTVHLEKERVENFGLDFVQRARDMMVRPCLVVVV